MKKTHEAINNWFKEHSLLERDVWCIHGWLYATYGYEMCLNWHCNGISRQSTYRDFIAWFNN